MQIRKKTKNALTLVLGSLIVFLMITLLFINIGTGTEIFPQATSLEHTQEQQQNPPPEMPTTVDSSEAIKNNDILSTIQEKGIYLSIIFLAILALCSVGFLLAKFISRRRSALMLENKDSKFWYQEKSHHGGDGNSFEEPDGEVEGYEDSFEEPDGEVEGYEDSFEEPDGKVEGYEDSFEEPDGEVEGYEDSFEEPNGEKYGHDEESTDDDYYKDIEEMDEYGYIGA